MTALVSAVYKVKDRTRGWAHLRRCTGGTIGILLLLLLLRILAKVVVGGSSACNGYKTPEPLVVFVTAAEARWHRCASLVLRFLRVRSSQGASGKHRPHDLWGASDAARAS
jgi:hypothetical protein